jgi:hypothetical protein
MMGPAGGSNRGGDGAARVNGRDGARSRDSRGDRAACAHGRGDGARCRYGGNNLAGPGWRAFKS